jgi:hypothetical protein
VLVGAGPSHKDHTLHEVPLPRSLMHDELLSRVKELLGLPAKATLQQVVNAQAAERQRSDREARLVGLAFAIRSAQSHANKIRSSVKNQTIA